LGVIAFFDASALIYLIEGVQPFAAAIEAQLLRLKDRQIILESAVSRLSWLECRVRPARRAEVDILAAFDAFFGRADLIWIELSKQVVELATAMRVHHNLRTPDALQAASCLQVGPDHSFITGDAGFRKVTGLNVMLLR
jgi:predicted nucleic acid-binding protein